MGEDGDSRGSPRSHGRQEGLWETEPSRRVLQTCYICEEQGRESKAASGACMTCNRHGCRQAFHVTW